VHPNNASKIDNMASKSGLIPFAEYDSKGEKKWGYLNEDSGEVAIAAKYDWADPFVGNYAVVRMNWGKKGYIIDKNEKTVCRKNFDKAYLITSENGNCGLAVLENKYTRKKFQIGISWGANISTRTGFYDVDYYKYSMINLVNGKTIFPKKENYLSSSIEVIGDYFVVDTIYTDGIYVYQFLENGDIKCVAKGKKENGLAVSLLKTYLEKRNITPDVVNADWRFDGLIINYNPYLKERFANPDLSGAFSSLGSDFPIAFDEAKPLYRNPWLFLNTPLEIKERKYIMHFKNKETQEYAVGIYNETKAEWEIKPDIIIHNMDTNKNELYYIVDIFETNNPNYYRLHLKNDNVKSKWQGLSENTETGWYDGSYLIVYGGIYNIAKHEFMKNLYLYDRESYPVFNLSSYPMDKRHLSIYFPDKGVYYRDYSRINEQ
jgi:hypothetical protein